MYSWKQFLKRKNKVMLFATWNFNFIHDVFFTFSSHKGLLSAEIDPSNYFLWLMCFSKKQPLALVVLLTPLVPFACSWNFKEFSPFSTTTMWLLSRVACLGQLRFGGF